MPVDPRAGALNREPVGAGDGEILVVAKAGDAEPTD